MNRTLVILHLLASSVSIVKPIDGSDTAKVEDANPWRSYESDVSTVLIHKDDILSTGDLYKLYNLSGTKFAKARFLKDETANDDLKKTDLSQESRADMKSEPANKSGDKPKEKEKGATPNKEEASKTANSLESKSEEKSGGSKVEEKEGIESKSSSKSGSKSDMMKSGEVASESNELDSNVTSLFADDRSGDYLENDTDENNAKNASDEDYGKKSYEVLVNDESNSNWDLLDDIPTSRRMLTQPEHLVIDTKGRNSDESIETGNVPLENTATSKNQMLCTDTFCTPTPPVITHPHVPNTVSIPYINPALLNQRRFIVPGFLSKHPNVHTEYRSLSNQERHRVITEDQNLPYTQGDGYAPPETRNVGEDYDQHIPTHDDHNAYPLARELFNTPKVTPVSNVNPIFAKLVEASGNPQKFTPKYNPGNFQNVPGLPFDNNIRPTYAVPQNYGIYKYVTGFGRSR